MTDIYDKKNMPRAIYCIHALSRYLFHLGIAPEIQDLKGIAQFTEEEISAMDSELAKAGVQMPKFGKIGGILAKEIGADAAASQSRPKEEEGGEEEKKLESRGRDSGVRAASHLPTFFLLSFTFINHHHYY